MLMSTTKDQCQRSCELLNEGCLDELRRCSKARNVPSDSTCLLDSFGRGQMQVQQASPAKSAPTLHHVFSTEKQKTGHCQDLQDPGLAR
jgi:hypothetical protein